LVGLQPVAPDDGAELIWFVTPPSDEGHRFLTEHLDPSEKAFERILREPSRRLHAAAPVPRPHAADATPDQDAKACRGPPPQRGPVGTGVRAVKSADDRYIRVAGRRVRARMRGKGPAVLLIHGLGCNVAACKALHEA